MGGLAPGVSRGGLPSGGATDDTGAVTVERYLVDSTHSNFQAYLAELNANQTPPAPTLQKVEEFTDYAVNNPSNDTGTLVLPQKTLNLGVTFWRVHQ